MQAHLAVLKTMSKKGEQIKLLSNKIKPERIISTITNNIFFTFHFKDFKLNIRQKVLCCLKLSLNVTSVLSTIVTKLTHWAVLKTTSKNVCIEPRRADINYQVTK